MRNIQKFNDDHLDKLLIMLDKEKMHNSFPKTVFHTFKKVQNRTSHIIGLNRDVLED
jgi:hypothetical protein